MSSSSSTLRQTLSAGFSGAVDFWPGTLFLFFASVFSVVLELTWPMLLLYLFLKSPAGIGALIAFLGLAWFWVQWVKGHLTVLAIDRALAPTGARSVSWLFSLKWVVATLPVEAFVSAWKMLALLSAGWAYASSLSSGQLGLGSSMALAWALLLASPLAFLLDVWKRVAWVHGVSAQQSVWSSFFDAAGILSKTPWPFIRFSLLSFLGVMSASMFFSPLSRGLSRPEGELFQWLAMALAGQFAVATWVAFVAAFIEMIQVFAYAFLLRLPDEKPLPQATFVLEQGEM